MRIEFQFDEQKIAEIGYQRKDVYYTIKKMFAERNIPCVSENDTLAFSDRGEKNDYANMWVVIMKLCKTKWFIDTATLCDWYPREGYYEDVLVQAKKDFRRKMRS